MLYERCLRPWLFSMDAERAHERALRALSLAQALPLGLAALRRAAGRPQQGLGVVAFGLHFPNPVGLAAGFDKDARLTAALEALGFGFLEVGSITLEAQPGNPRPRLFRLPDYEAIINRLGFNSRGADFAARALSRARRLSVPLGVNLGLNATAGPEQAPGRYAETFSRLEPYGDYFAINVSSPNTTGLRDLQERLRLGRILEAIQERNPRRKPVLVKLSPDLSDEQLQELLPVVSERAAGVIAANTTVSREGLPGDLPELRGGLSGAPLRARSTALIKKIYNLTRGRLPIIGVGGVMTGADAFEKIMAGATLVQTYTGLVYRGPAAAVKIQRELADCLARAGFARVADAVGRGSEANR